MTVNLIRFHMMTDDAISVVIIDLHSKVTAIVRLHIYRYFLSYFVVVVVVPHLLVY